MNRKHILLLVAMLQGGYSIGMEEKKSILPSPRPEYRLFSEIADTGTISEDQAAQLIKIATENQRRKKREKQLGAKVVALEALRSHQFEVSDRISNSCGQEIDKLTGTVQEKHEKTYYLAFPENSISDTQQFETDRAQYTQHKETQARFNKLQEKEQATRSTLKAEEEQIINLNQQCETLRAQLQEANKRLQQHKNLFQQNSETFYTIMLAKKVFEKSLQESKAEIDLALENKTCTLNKIKRQIKESEEKLLKGTLLPDYETRERKHMTSLGNTKDEIQKEWYSLLRDKKLVEGTYSTGDALWWKTYGTVSIPDEISATLE